MQGGDFGGRLRSRGEEHGFRPQRSWSPRREPRGWAKAAVPHSRLLVVGEPLSGGAGTARFGKIKWASPNRERLTSRSRSALGNSNHRDLQWLHSVTVIVGQQVRAIFDGRGAALAQSRVAVAVRWLHSVAAVFAHPALELSVLILYHRNSGRHDSPRDHSRGQRRARKVTPDQSRTA